MTGKNERGLLYHYTDVKGLVGILKTGKIRMSDPRTLNDAREMVHGQEMVKRAIRVVGETFRERFAELGYDGDNFERLVSQQVSKIRFFAPPDIFHAPLDRAPFIACFSEAENQLSQWRAYGNSHYSLGFDRAFLQSKADALVKVQYSDPNDSINDLTFHTRHPFPTSRNIETALNTMLQYYRQHKSMHMEVLDETLDSFVTAMNNEHFLLRQKHISFEEEREVRLIKYVRPSEPEVYVSDRARYPSIKIDHPIFEPIKQVNEAVKAIWSGPGTDAAQMHVSFDALRSKFGFTGTRHISDSPHRTS